MERALDIEALEVALGAHPEVLPTPKELQRLIANSEIGLFMERPALTDSMLRTAWYLHSVASAPRAEEVYATVRQRHAFAISAHIFELALASLDKILPVDRLRLRFAAQVGYLRSELDPNALAVGRREPIEAGQRFGADPAFLSLTLGVGFLSQRRSFLYKELKRLLAEGRAAARGYGAEAPVGSTLGAGWSVVAGTYELLVFLTYGDRDRLEAAVEALDVGAKEPHSDLHSRWVAAHLQALAKDLGRSSVWSVLPPGVPPVAARAMVFGDPSVMSLWPPQLRLLTEHTSSPLASETIRVFLSVPTSAGKTLVAQYLVIAHILSTRGRVAFVAPTNSLCREIRSSLAKRLRIVSREARVEDNLFRSGHPGAADVDVMTPERLSFLVRNDLSAYLENYSLTIIDEAHVIGDESRGLGLEASLSILLYALGNRPHRLILMSAAIGNRAELHTWISPDGTGVNFHEVWRGPRRLTGLYNCEVDWNSRRLEEPTNQNAFPRALYTKRGMLWLRVGGHTTALPLKQSVGVLARKVRKDGKEDNQRDPKRSSRFYAELVPLVRALERHGPVLTICSTRNLAQRFALALSAATEERQDAALARLVAYVENRLGADHPLAASLRRGIAFHHAALPSDVQARIEAAVRSGTLSFIAATSTLAEGVNLPVRSVVISDQGIPNKDGSLQKFITGPRLLNAIGRAGRAVRETEGWVVIAVQRKYSPALFKQLDVSPDSLRVTSAIATDKALEELEALESKTRDDVDAIFDTAAGGGADFVSFLWTALTALGDVGISLRQGQLEGFLSRTLAWQQLSEPAKKSSLRLSRAVWSSYEQTSPDKRRRWAQSGLSLGTARKLDELASRLAREAESEGVSGLQGSLRLLLEAWLIDAILAFPEAPKELFRVGSHRAAPVARRSSVNAVPLTRAWASGMSFRDMATIHLTRITDDAFRYERLADIVAKVFSSYLPWVLGSVVAWANEELGENWLVEISELAPLAVKMGIDVEAGLVLALGGVSRRELAANLGRAFPGDESSDANVREWVRSLGAAAWTSHFGATESDREELLDFVRDAESRAVEQVLSGGTGFFQVRPFHHVLSGEVLVTESSGTSLQIQRGDQVVAEVAEASQLDVEQVLRSGIPVVWKLKQIEDHYLLTGSLAWTGDD